MPGISGIGEKTALSLIQAYGSIDSLYSELESADKEEQIRMFRSVGVGLSHLERLLEEPKKKKDLVGKQAAYLSKKLVQLDCAVPGIEETQLSEVAFSLERAKREVALSELEFESLLDKMPDKRQLALF